MSTATVVDVDPAEASASVAESMERLTTVTRRTVRDAAARFDLQPAAWGVFRFVLRTGRLQAHTIVSELGMDKGAVSRHLKELRLRGLIETERDEVDARIVWISASETARARAAEATEQWMARLQGLLGTWTEEEAELFSALLDRFSRADWTPPRG